MLRGVGRSGVNAAAVAEVISGLEGLLEAQPRLDGCALSLWKAYVLANSTVTVQ